MVNLGYEIRQDLVSNLILPIYPIISLTVIPLVKFEIQYALFK